VVRGAISGAPAILAAMAARLAGHPVKLSLTRREMYALAGYRTPTIQRLRLRIGAAGMGTGARTALTQIAADALDAPVERVRVEVGDSAFPDEQAAGGSMGTTSWGSAVIKACRALREQGGGEARADTAADVEHDAPLAKHAFGAQFAEVAVDLDSGEVRVPRLLGVFAVGRVINPKTARSQ
jgi:xanthine dehydrogenase YagR molybdenum-binding subunit